VPMLYLKNGNTKFISKSQFDPWCSLINYPNLATSRRLQLFFG
jgi:hypothetical protein